MQTFEKAFVGSVAVALVLAGAVIMWTNGKEAAEDKLNFVDVSKCVVVGTAIDQTRGYKTYRKIYKCPDETIHIR